jgi:hypothetical protein
MTHIDYPATAAMVDGVGSSSLISDRPTDTPAADGRPEIAASEPVKGARKLSWRDVLPIHPAAEMFPRIGADELAELGKDIETNGLQTSIVLIRESGKEDQLLEGVSRLDAIESRGIDLVLPDGTLDRALGLGRDDRVRVVAEVDPYAYVASANLHRRHLTVEQRRELAAKLLTAAPEKSNRQIAKIVKIDPKTVAAVRTEKETTGEIPQLTKTVGADGKARSSKPKTAPKRAQRKASNPAPAGDEEKSAPVGNQEVMPAAVLPELNPETEPSMQLATAAIAKWLARFSAAERREICNRAIASLEDAS